MNLKPRRGEIWTAYLGDAPKRHWVVVVSPDNRNLSDRVSSILIVPFGSYGAEGPTVTSLPSGETGLPEASYLKAHYIQVLQKKSLIEPHRRMLSTTRMRQLVDMIRRAVDPDAPWIGR
ncbi:MAG TPA: type II toxin-antitoxin system PemK/MazF family toxin [Candidatus Sulfotelmatobacter sp.]|nr:type II toxin-antitoxin system PemK/MazF family toxin [Candidatus Sulfotelmatobacter sp.]